MISNATKPELTQPEPETAAHLFDNWFDPIETGLRDRVREFIRSRTICAARRRAALLGRCRPSGNQRVGDQRTPLVSSQRLALPLRRLAIGSVQPGARHLDFQLAEDDSTNEFFQNSGVPFTGFDCYQKPATIPN
jgi:hypothetical protein